MAFTVTATESGASASHGVALVVRVLTNATESGGATSGSTGGGVTAQGSLTPNFSASYIAFSVSADNVTAMPAAAASNTYDLTTGNPSDVWSTAQGHYTGTVTASTPLTYGAGSAGSGDHANWCAYEIPASGGTVTLDGSSPAGVISGSGLGSGTAATTASFTPPTGAVLVAEVCAGGTGTGAGITMTITDTSGLGLIWTRRAVSSTSDNFQPTWVYTTTIPSVFTGISTTGWRAAPGLTWASRFRRRQHPPEIAPTPPVPVYPPQQQAQPGPAWKTHYRLPQRPKPTAPTNPPCIIGQSGTGLAAYFADRFGNPVLYFGGETWGLPANAGRWNGGDWRADYDFYHATRRGQGYTANVTHPFGHTHTGCNNDLGHTWDGVFPFLVNGSAADLTGQGGTVTLNATFWQRIDYMFQSAAVMGITVFLDLSMSLDMPTGAAHGFTNGVFQNATTAQIQTASQRVAERYALTENLVWFFGDDYYNDDDTNYNAMWTGINAADPRIASCTSIEYYPTGNTARYDLGDIPANETPHGWGNTHATYQFVYTYQQTYFGIEYAYLEPSPIGPVIWGDGMFWGNGGTSAQNDQLQRNAVWWALASGARGVVAENENVLQWSSTAAASLTGDGQFPSWAKNIYTLFSGLNGWWKLIPDTGNQLVTAGRGTRAVYSGSEYLANTDNYVAASITPDGSLAVIYCAQAMSITIDQTKLGSGYTATWADPASGALTGTSTGSTYSSSGLGNNSAGGADWVLILQGPAVSGSSTATAGVASATAVANAPQAAVTVTAGVAASSAVANAPTVSTVAATNAPAGVATASAVALAAQASEGVSAAVAASSAVALQPAASVAPGAAAAVSGAVALAPKAAAGISAGPAAGTGTALAPVPAAGVIAAVAPASAIALAPVVNTSGSVNAVAGVAAASAAAPAALAAVTSAAGAATGTAPAPAPVPAAAVLPAAGTARALAQAATVTTGNVTNASAGVASASALALAPATAVTFTAAAARSLAVALAAAGTGNVPPVRATSSPLVAAGTSTSPAVTGTPSGPQVTTRATSSPATT